jgi:phosphoribosylformimino-5-aminoimidazole carboxamide ribotide isomerase
MSAFTIYPAIDLHEGRVVRLAQGDLTRQTWYGNDPAGAARRWLDAGTTWLHVVNLDGAFDQPDQANRQAVLELLSAASSYRPARQVQLGGGLRSLAALEQALEAGVSRVVLGTAAIQEPEMVAEAVRRFGDQRVAAGLDAKDGVVMLHGWTEASGLNAIQAAEQLKQRGVKTIIYTDISRDGVGKGINQEATQALAAASGLEVIASGGVHSLEDIRQVKRAGLAGVVIGRALYDGRFTLQEALAC